MTEHDVIKFMGRFPDKIVKKSMMDSGIWNCSICDRVKLEGKGPCECGSIFWIKKSQ